MIKLDTMNNNGIKGNGNDLTMIQSATIDLLRFPFIILVIFAHIFPYDTNTLSQVDIDLSTISGVYNVIRVSLSHVMGKVPVPTFYFISGFLFFVNFQRWSWDGYKRKMKSRVRTLIIPYLLWNTIPFLFGLFVLLARVIIQDYSIEEVQNFFTDNSWHIIYDCKEWVTNDVNWLGDNLKMTAPYDYPLWYLRDLIFVTFLSPIIYFSVRNKGLITIGILFIAYISRIWISVPGFHISAIFFFSTGAFFALNNINIIQFVHKYRIFLPICLLLLVVTTIYDGYNTIIGRNVFPFFVCTGVLSAFYVASTCILRYNISPNKLLVSSCFFIFAIHAGFPFIGSPMSFCCRLLHKIIPGSTGWEDIVCYLASPFATAFFCIVLLMMIRRLFPKLTMYLCGNRQLLVNNKSSQ